MERHPEQSLLPLEPFDQDSLACNFCLDMEIPQGESLLPPPCHRCIGLIYAQKARSYFVVS